ncbi:hypothetical protein CABS01_14350 [Colletotrichum abscissum]|uniref:Uncharacterized protein n=3 Tax=Colletotrichum acutatum species complex TaxID=2707335 RepID=A0AAI9YF20_9PEZI|nr:uncharacterized protein CCOS01_16726 [Colletotrichum costaricense]XP_060393396.1 uncharacterized protein CABS01_14350 [Colletotrichum abscissum]KAI3548558.1 hypothetical protein CSPX01_02987 [Colletotrichum filicis]KAK1449718.1 hypothetical protein CMEL01_07054 [Colletotrichum melonis]KAK1490484.1 hypothetical protein CCUS01_14441 [Colletotrichum cuscutae]KAK1480824.1 hypothetical protein CABS01_14350 [Colletotrichum abscissum]KAK1505152.1 hypothetical protein CCOS01_16726 [Colletotrichum 
MYTWRCTTTKGFLLRGFSLCTYSDLLYHWAIGASPGQPYTWTTRVLLFLYFCLSLFVCSNDFPFS